MTEHRIAVVSQNRELFQFFLLECKMNGFLAEQFSGMPTTPSAYRFIFWDTDTVAEPRISFANLITVSSDSHEREQHLRVPVSLKCLREMLLASSETQTDVSEKQTDHTTVFLYDRGLRQILFAERILTLSEYELKILECLCQAGGEAVSREELNRLIGVEKGNTVDVYVSYLRKKLETACDRMLIHTVRGIGYRTELVFSKEVRE